MSDNAKQRRRFPRIPSRHAVLVKRLSGEELEGFAAIKSVGTGGCGFLSDEELGTDSVLESSLISMDRQVIRAKARVMTTMSPIRPAAEPSAWSSSSSARKTAIVLEQLTDE